MTYAGHSMSNETIARLAFCWTRVDFISASLQDAPIGTNLVLLLLDDESECS
jgi:hypothetical protein